MPEGTSSDRIPKKVTLAMRPKTNHENGGSSAGEDVACTSVSFCSVLVILEPGRWSAFVQQYPRATHQALAMQVPADRNATSHRPYRGLSELDDLQRDWASTVHVRSHLLPESKGQSQSGVCGTAGGDTAGGRAHLARHLHALRSWIFDDETCRLEPIDNPFGPTVLPTSPE